MHLGKIVRQMGWLRDSKSPEAKDASPSHARSLPLSPSLALAEVAEAPPAYEASPPHQPDPVVAALRSLATAVAQQEAEERALLDAESPGQARRRQQAWLRM